MTIRRFDSIATVIFPWSNMHFLFAGVALISFGLFYGLYLLFNSGLGKLLARLKNPNYQLNKKDSLILKRRDDSTLIYILITVLLGTLIAMNFEILKQQNSNVFSIVLGVMLGLSSSLAFTCGEQYLQAKRLYQKH